MHISSTAITLILLALTHGVTTAGAAGDSDRTLVQEAVIDKSVGEIWWHFSTTEGARQWMAPKLKMDLRIGGEIRSSYHPDSTLDDEHTIINRILTYLPERMIAIQNVQAPEGFGNAELFQQTWSVMTFEPRDENRTNVRLAGLNYGIGQEWDAIYDHFGQGNIYLLNLLKKLPQTDDDAAVRAHRELTKRQMNDAVQHEVTVNCSLDAAWRSWTTSEGIGAFFAPQSTVELHIGGPYELYFAPDAPDGQRGSEGCRILAYEPKRMLSFSWNAPPQFPNVRDYHTWVVLEFASRDDEHEGVTIRLTQLGFEQLQAAHPEHAEEFARTRAYFDRVWPHVLDSLKRTLESD